MLPNDDLLRWGEPPTDASELALAELLADALQQPSWSAETLTRVQQSPEATGLLRVCRWIDEMMSLVSEQTGIFAEGVEVRLSVSRLVAGVYESVASTQPRPYVVRDLRRIPDNPDRVTLRTGDRVRIEVACDRNGYMTVFNVGPQGALNVLYPFHASETGAFRSGDALRIDDVELTPPVGRERVYAVWSREPLALERGTLRDMKRVQESLGQRRPDDWHAVLLELAHAT
jgi:hypothetical protein